MKFCIAPAFSILIAINLTLTISHQANAESAIEVIEVQALKRLENAQHVGLSLSHFSGAQLEAFELKDSSELALLAPNVTVTSNASEGSPPSVFIRGVGLLDYNTSNTSPVSFYVDQVATGSVSNQVVHFYDMAGVEVIRGPQGTLFGRNTTGGAILFHSNKPEQSFAASTKAAIGSGDYRNAEAMLNLPITDNTATRFAASWHDYDYTATNNLFSDAPQEGLKQLNWRWLTQTQLDDLDILFKVHGSDWSGITLPYGNIGVNDPLTMETCSTERILREECVDNFGFNADAADFHDVSVDNDSPHDTNSLGASLQLDRAISDNLMLSWIASLNNLDRTHVIHCDGNDLDVCVGYFDLKTELTTQELRLTGENHSLKWIAGLYYLNETIEQDNSIDLFRDLRILNPALAATPGSGVGQYFYDNKIETESLAAFSQFDWQLSSQTSVIAGIRYTDESTKVISDTDVNIMVDTNLPAGITVPAWLVKDTIDNKKWSGKLGINYQLDTDTLFYSSLSNGFKSGGYNGGFLFFAEQAELAAYGPETLNAFEIGNKINLFENQVRINSAAFVYQYKNQQVFMNQASATPNAPPLQLLENVADSKIYGLETDILYQANRDLTLQLTLGYLPTAKFEQYTDPVGNELTDNRLPTTPKWDVSALAQYDFANFNTSYVSALITTNYKSEFYFDQNENPITEQDSVNLVNASLSWRDNQETWDISLWAKNLTDEDYYHLKFDLVAFLGMVNNTKAEARRYGLSVTYRFH